jgi:hypothetical protein
MKKITLNLFALLLASTTFGQIYSTGMMTLFPNYFGRIDVDNDLVALTLVGPSTAWLGMSFGSTGMDNLGNDVVLFDGTNMTDRTFNGVGVIPPLDAIQNWTVVSNTINAGVRTVVATRARDTGDANDYVFSAAPGPLNLAFARRTGSLVVGYHGGGNCGTTVANFTLGNASFETTSFKMYPNPAKEYTTIELPESVPSAEVKVYDNLGRVVKKQNVSAEAGRINTSDLPRGSYLVVVRTDYGNSTKSLLVE